MARHSEQTTLEGVHIATRFEFPDATARAAANFTLPAVKPAAHSGTLTAADVGSVAFQQDDLSFWILQEHTGPTWLSFGQASSILGDLKLQVLKGSAGTITKGQVVYPAGWNIAGSVDEVELAQADSSATMPACGLAAGNITDAVPGLVTLYGEITGVNTSAWSLGDALYVSATTPGTLTNVKPTGATDLIQKVGVVQYVHASDGVILVIGAGRTNDVPNLSQGYTWVGDANNHASEVLLPGAHWRGSSATNPSSPVQGDSYYNTALDMVFNYDDTRAKWLSVESETFSAGRRDATATGSYFRFVDEITMSADRGWYMPASGTLVAIGVTRSNALSATVEVTVDGSALAELALGTATEAGSMALNADFASGVRLAVRNKTGGNDIDDTVVWIAVRWRV